MSDRIEAEIIDVLGEEVAAAVDTPLVVIEGPKGDPGAPGKDGHSPVVTATKSGKTTTISVDGAAIATVEDGKDGTDGQNGAPGVYYGKTQPTGETHPVWIDPDGEHDDGGLLPAVTDADNGKVLRVVNSAWSAEDMPTGGTDMGITGATVGQIAKITAVDESGTPTAWAPVDFPSGGGGSTSESEEIVVETHTISELPAGRTAIVSGLSKYKKFMMQWVFKDTSASSDNNCYMCFNESGSDYVPYRLGHGTAWKQYACVVVENYENSALMISGADGSSDRGTMYYPQAFSAPIDKFGPRWLDSAITTIDGTITIYGILKDTSVLESV